MNNNTKTRKRHQPRVTGEVRYRGCRAKVDNLSMDEFLEAVAALECKTR